MLPKLMSQNSDGKSCGIVVLAAGLGKRMRSSVPKVLHELNGKPLLFHVLQHVKQVLPHAPVAIVVGYGRDKVESYLARESELQSMKLSTIFQSEQRGTGDAARCVMMSDWGKQIVQNKSLLLIIPGDLPLITDRLIYEMLPELKRDEVMRLLTCELPNPTGYGRVIRRGKSGPVLRIVEEKDANTKEKEIREVSASIYLFQSVFLEKSLQRLTTNNAQGEYYLTDVIQFAVKQKKKIAGLLWKTPEDLKGVNDPWELAQAGRCVNERLIQGWSMQGVRFIDFTSVQLDATVSLSAGVVVHPGAILLGSTRVGAGTVIGPRVVLKDVSVGENVDLKTGTIAEQSQIGSGAKIGPYAHLRPESVVGARVKIGNFVELKKTRIEEDTSIAHLSYLGDAEVGKNVNIGCGFVTCNYDGRVIEGQRKHRTIIEDGVFLGSDCQTVAPVRVGKGAYVASGSTVTEDVPPGALAIARSAQINKLGYAQRLTEAKKSKKG